MLDGATAAFDKPYSYRIPATLSNQAQVGCRVIVPFGRGNRKKQGLIVRLDKDADENFEIKPLLDVLDEQPILSPEMLELCGWIREQTFSTYFDVIHTMLPFGMDVKLVETVELINDLAITPDPAYAFITDYLSRKKGGCVAREKLIKDLELDDDLPLVQLEKAGVICLERKSKRNMNDAVLQMVHPVSRISSGRITPQQQEVLTLLDQIGDVSIKEIVYFTGVSTSVIHTMERNGLVELYDKEVFRYVADFPLDPVRNDIVLTDEQQAAFDQLKNSLTSPDGCCHLLYGVTGSGKTQVFLQLVDEVVDRGLGVIVMVPEIALTPQTLAHFGNRYGRKVAVFHSAMSYGQRMDEWKRVKNGEALVAIGTRSAVFAPFEKLGLIIMDEEQEHTYKSEQSPRFHARNVAKFRAHYHKCLLMLASATPSVESYTLAKTGVYGLSTIRHRYGRAKLPQVKIVDMRREILSGNNGVCSRPLQEALDEALADKKQGILLLNRRGFNTYVTCPSCGYVATCPNCSISMTYHAANHRMMCHYCGYSEPVPKSCPGCQNGHLRYLGIGTQKLEEELRALFPKARILRLDADSTVTRGSFAKQLSKFAAGEYDLLIGTQMVAKGLDFPRVTVVGVIGADQSLYSDDYRSFERTFSLLTQVVGRAGRGDFSGKALIQTTSPESDLIRLATKQDYESFYENEILTRKMLAYPPYCNLVQVLCSGQDRELVESSIFCVFDAIRKAVSDDQGIRLTVLGPGPAAVPKVNNRYRYRMLIKCYNSAAFRSLLRQAVASVSARNVTVTVDIDPETVS